MKRSQDPKKKKKIKKAVWRRRVLLLLLLMATIISICLFTPIFNVKTVEVVGIQTITEEQILQAAAIPTEINIFKIRARAASKAIRKIPEVESVKIRRILPGKVRLEIVETQPALYFPYLNGFVTTNVNGRVMGIFDSEAELNLLKITGLEIKKAEICKKIAVQDTVTFDIIIETMQQFQSAGLLPEIRSCHFDNLSDFQMYLFDGTKIIFGKTTDMEYKLSVLMKVLEQVNRTEGAYIDLTTPERTVYGILQPEQPEPEEGSESEESTETEENLQEESDTSETDIETSDHDEDETGQSESEDLAESSEA